VLVSCCCHPNRTPEFHAANDAVILKSIVTVPRGQGDGLAERVLRIVANGPSNKMELRLHIAMNNFMARNPGVDMGALLSTTIGEFGMFRRQIEGS
jgi:hypothetical protein